MKCYIIKSKSKRGKEVSVPVLANCEEHAILKLPHLFNGRKRIITDIELIT